MAVSTAKENILKRIRQALSKPVPLPFPHSKESDEVFPASSEDDAIVFAEAFSRLQGKFAFCENEGALQTQLTMLLHEKGWDKVYCREQAFLPLLHSVGIIPFEDLATCDVSITGCEYLVARTGSIVLSSGSESGRTGSVYAPVHICVAYNRQLVFDLKDALSFLKEKYGSGLPSLISFATGPSRTADIEKTLVTGVHGPKEVYCFLLEA